MRNIKNGEADNTQKEDEKSQIISSTQMERKCYSYRRLGYKSQKYNDKNTIPCKDQATNKAQLMNKNTYNNIT